LRTEFKADSNPQPFFLTDSSSAKLLEQEIQKEGIMHKLLIVSMFLAAVPELFAGNPHCKQVGGAISTNFLDASTTLGTATGDLKGALGVTVQSEAPGPNGAIVFRNQHHWVTESGDTLSLQDADATAFPTAVPAFVAISYTQGVQVIGGTGRFAGANGTLTIWGAADLSRQQIVLRYQGQICKP
jgi:hypothetical protein